MTTIFDAMTPATAEILFAGLCACKADDYVDIGYHVTMAWQRRFHFDEPDFVTKNSITVVARTLLDMHRTAHELNIIGFKPVATPLSEEMRPKFDEAVKAMSIDKKRRNFVDVLIAEYHAHKEATS